MSATGCWTSSCRFSSVDRIHPLVPWWTERLLPRSMNESNELRTERFPPFLFRIFLECIITLSRDKTFPWNSQISIRDFVDRSIDRSRIVRVRKLLLGSWSEKWRDLTMNGNSYLRFSTINPLYDHFLSVYLYTCDRSRIAFETAREERGRGEKN